MGVFNFSPGEIKKLQKKELSLKFLPMNETVKDKHISYTLHNFNKMAVLQFSKSVKDTDICISIELEKASKPMNEFTCWS